MKNIKTAIRAVLSLPDNRRGGVSRKRIGNESARYGGVKYMDFYVGSAE